MRVWLLAGFLGCDGLVFFATGILNDGLFGPQARDRSALGQGVRWPWGANDIELRSYS